MQDLAQILAEVVPHGHYVGGIVRSSLLKRQSGDIDITLPADEVKPVSLALAKRLKAATFEMDPELGVWRLVTHQHKIQIDLTAYQGKDLPAGAILRLILWLIRYLPNRKLLLLRAKMVPLKSF